MRFTSRTCPAQAAAVRRAARTLRTAGARAEPWGGPSFAAAMDLFTAVLTNTGENVRLEKLITGRDHLSVLGELSRVFRGQSLHTLPTLLVILGERFVKPSPLRAEQLCDAARTLRDEIDDVLGDDGVLILPTYPRPAPFHRTTMLHPFDIAYTAVFNATDHPVTAVPMGLDAATAAPTGVQIVARRGNDHLTISAALALERWGAARWTPPE